MYRCMSFFTHTRHYLDTWNVSLWFWYTSHFNPFSMNSFRTVWLRSWLGPQGTDIPATLSSPPLAECRLGLESWQLDETGGYIFEAYLILWNIGKGISLFHVTMTPNFAFVTFKKLNWPSNNPFCIYTLEHDWSQEWSLLMTRTHRMSPCRIFLSIVVDNLLIMAGSLGC